MEDTACNVLYVDYAAREERLVRRGDSPLNALRATEEIALVDGQTTPDTNQRALFTNVETLLGTFSKVYLCPSGSSCLRNMERLNAVPTKQLVPMVVLIDVPDDDNGDTQPPPDLNAEGQVDDSSIYGSSLLRYITDDIKAKGLSTMVIPVVVKRMKEAPAGAAEVALSPRDSSPSFPAPNSPPMLPQPERGLIQVPPKQKPAVKYVDIGSVVALDNPICADILPGLATHVYRVYKEYVQCGKILRAPTNKRYRNWVGVEPPKPYPHLREIMVSDLMGQITGTIVEHPVDPVELDIDDERKEAIKKAISAWSFAAHDFSQDELMYAAVLMVEHALSVPELEEYRIASDKLVNFIDATRRGYNDYVPYHNFRHVIDVLQAVFYMLVRIGTLPSYPPDTLLRTEPKSPLVQVMRPFEALALLIAAIGHDVGHPGVNNLFLVRLKAPLAQLYNDKSVLESFHSATYSHMLKKHWPAIMDNDDMKQLLTSCILSTDMAIHNEYMEKLEKLQYKLTGENRMKSLPDKDLKMYRHLACNLLIKCADISNVARPFDCAATWTATLADEFMRQAAMEIELSLTSALFAPPAQGMIGLGKSQVGFMNVFAIPLFAGVADVMPTTSFCIEEILHNRAAWEVKIREAANLPSEEAAATHEREDSEDSHGQDQSRTSPPEAHADAGRSASAPDTLMGESGNDFEAHATGAAGIPESDNRHPPLVRDQQSQSQPQSSSRPSSRPVTWDDGAERGLGPELLGTTSYRRSETTDGSASVPESGEWTGSAGTEASAKTEKAGASTARTSVDSGGIGKARPSGSGGNRKSLVGSSSTPDLRDSAVREGLRRVSNRSSGRSRERGERDSVFASMRELTRRPSLGRFKFWRRRDGGSGSGSPTADGPTSHPVPALPFGSTSMPRGLRSGGGSP